MTNRPQHRLEREAELFRLLAENVKDYAIFILDVEGRVQTWSKGAEHLLGYGEDEILGEPCDLLFTPEDVEKGVPRQEREQALATGRGEDERWHIRKDGTRFWSSGVMTPLIDEAGALRGFAKIMRDRTDIKIAEEELARHTREAERRRRLYEAALSNTPDLVYVFDRNHRFTYANEGLLAMWGRTWEEAIGKNCLELGYEPWHAAMHDREIEQVIATRRPIKGEVPFTGTFGRRIYEYIFVPVLGENGEVEAVAGTTRDVTDRRQAEERLRHSEERFRALMEQAPISIQMFSPDGRTLQVNRAWEELWGIRIEQIDGYNVLEDPQLEAKGVLPYIRQGFAGQPTRIPAIEYNPNDTIPDITQEADPRRWLAAVIYPLKDAEGQVREVVLIHEDITARHRAEEALTASEREFRELADAMPQIVFTAGPDGRADYFNRRWHELTGLPAGKISQESWLSALHPDDREACLTAAREARRSGEPFEMELRLLDARSGEYRWHLARSLPVRDKAGRILRWYGASTDIHDRKRAEDAAHFLARASASLAAVVDYESTLQKVAGLAVPYFADWSAVDMANEDGTLRRLAVVHQDPDKVRLAQELAQRHPPEPDAPAGIAKVFRTGEAEIVGEVTADMLVSGARDGDHLRLLRALKLRSYICVPLIVGARTRGALTFAMAESGRRYTQADLAVAQDLAQRAAIAIENAELYRELREADRRKDEFLATLAHELRNPLAPIGNSLQILKMPRIDADAIQETREVMERQIHHLVRLVDDLLDVSRVMRGKIELRKEPVELASVVARAVETAQPMIDAQGHELLLDLPDEALLLEADPVRLAQVVGNLLTNAAKYTEPRGRIWLTGQRATGEAILRVRDNGIGIAPEMRDRVFELFVQADHAATRAQGGLGIGLTLVKSLVEMHGGQVRALSEGLGKGSEFVVRLPLASNALPAPVEESRQQAARSAGHRLLVVDDNQDAANSLAMLLRLQGHEVHVAHDGPSALELARRHRPALVLLDIGMPGMDGYEVARRMRRLPGLEGVRLTALTGWGQQEDRRRSAEAGFDRHLVKPADPKTLDELLADLQPPANS